MHGIVFTSFRDYLRVRRGSDFASEIFEGEIYAMSEAYPDDAFVRLLARAGERMEVAGDELLRDFGAFTGEMVFPRLYTAFYTVAGGTLPFLLTIENRIHELVRATIPNAAPPELHVTASEAGVEIAYTSPRHLCRLLEGLVVGTGRHFREDVTVEEVACAKKGKPACLFEVGAKPSDAEASHGRAQVSTRRPYGGDLAR